MKSRMEQKERENKELQAQLSGRQTFCFSFLQDLAALFFLHLFIFKDKLRLLYFTFIICFLLNK